MNSPTIRPYDPAEDAWQDSGDAPHPPLPGQPTLPAAEPPQPATGDGERSAAGSNYGDWRPARRSETPSPADLPEPDRAGVPPPPGLAPSR